MHCVTRAGLERAVKRVEDGKEHSPINAHKKLIIVKISHKKCEMEQYGQLKCLLQFNVKWPTYQRIAVNLYTHTHSHYMRTMDV